MSPLRPRVKAAVRRVGGRPLARARRARQTPLLSVVMPVYNVAEYLPAALDSVLSQTLTDLEVIAVDDGSTDECLEILRAYERRDYRVRVLTQPNSGQGVARNLGVQSARGEFLTFLDSDDTLPPDAYATMAQGLQRSGSDFAVGNLRRLRHGELHRMIWSRTVHRQDRVGVRIEEFPEALQDIIACNRMFRTEFWRVQVGGFRGGIAYEDHVPMLTAYVRAQKFDVLQKVTYHWRIREDLTSTGQQKARLGNLQDRITVKQEAHELLEAEAPAGVYAAWVGRALEVDFPPFLPFALTGDAAYRSLLAQTYRTFLDRVTPAALEHVRVAMRVRAHLAAQERWEELFTADDWLREVQNMPPTRVADGRLVAAFPQECPWADALPADERWMSPLESHFEGAVEHLEWEEDRLRITGWAVLRGLSMKGAAGGTRVRAWVVDVADPTTRIPLEVRQVDLPEADVWGPLAHATCAGGGFVATVDLTGLAGSPVWAVHAEVEQEGLTASGGLHGRVARSAAVRESSGLVLGVADGLSVTACWEGATGLTLRVTPGLAVDPYGAQVQVAEVELLDDAVVVTVETSLRGEQLAQARLVSPAAELPLLAHSTQHGRTRLTFPVTAPDLDGIDRPAPTGTYALVVRGARMPHAHAGRGLAGRSPVRAHGQAFDLAAGQRPDGRFVLVLSPPLRADELGPANQHRLRRHFRSAPAAVGDSVVLSHGPGHHAAGDQLAMDRWLARHRPDLTRFWTVADARTAVPEGALALVRGSREWYDALAGACFVSSDTDLGPWYRPRPQQHHLRTFDGHPYEPMGIGAWRREGMIEHLVNREVQHVREQWDRLLAPDEESVALLREQFRWDGEVVVAGSPRTDAIVTADRDDVRRRVLRRLGLEDAVLVLHAPAARDDYDVATPEGREALDYGALLEHLPAGHVLLHRSPPHDRRPAPTLTGDRVRDVSDYPDPADLVVAADAAILDHSPLRFDWALTGRPALFYVPDLEAWARFREPLLPWEETAPGPWLRTVPEVLDQLRDLDRVSAAYAGAVARFNERFNALNDGAATARALAPFFGG